MYNMFITIYTHEHTTTATEMEHVGRETPAGLMGL